MALTSAKTITFVRKLALKQQVLTLLGDAANASPDDLEKIGDVLTHQRVGSVTIMGLYPDNGDLGAELRITIDWRQHEIAIQAGGENIQVPPNWENGVAPTTHTAAILFNDACQEDNLNKQWCFQYTQECTSQREQLNEEYGFVNSPQRKWRKPPIPLQPFEFGPLTELNVVLTVRGE